MTPSNTIALRRFFEQGEQHFAYAAPGLSTPTVTSYYYLRDHLGSIRANTGRTKFVGDGFVAVDKSENCAIVAP